MSRSPLDFGFDDLPTQGAGHIPQRSRRASMDLLRGSPLLFLIALGLVMGLNWYLQHNCWVGAMLGTSPNWMALCGFISH